METTGREWNTSSGCLFQRKEHSRNGQCDHGRWTEEPEQPFGLRSRSAAKLPLWTEFITPNRTKHVLKVVRSGESGSSATPRGRTPNAFGKSRYSAVIFPISPEQINNRTNLMNL